MRTPERALTRVYRATARRVDPAGDETVEIRPGLTVPRFVLEWSRSAPHEAATLLDRLSPLADPLGRTVATLGRGAGDVAIEAARRGAREVVAIDMASRRMELSRIRLEENTERLPVAIGAYPDALLELSDRRFELVIAADAFRSYGAEPSSPHVEQRAREMSGLLKAGGVLAVASGPSWRAPFGGSVDSRLPWAHLLFPEPVIFAEFRRARPGSSARTFDDIGINRVTIVRLRAAIAAAGFEPIRLATNVGGGVAMRMVRPLSGVPRLGEYFTQNAYDVWQRRA